MVGSPLENLPFVHIASDHLAPPGGCDLGALCGCDSEWVRVIWGLSGGLLLVQEDCVPHLVLPVLGSPVLISVFLLLGLGISVLLLCFQ